MTRSSTWGAAELEGAQAGLEAGQLPELGREPSCAAASVAKGALSGEASELAGGCVLATCTVRKRFKQMATT